MKELGKLKIIFKKSKVLTDKLAPIALKDVKEIDSVDVSVEIDLVQ